jgi:hypothetical protein
MWVSSFLLSAAAWMQADMLSLSHARDGKKKGMRDFISIIIIIIYNYDIHVDKCMFGSASLQEAGSWINAKMA